MSKEAPEGTVWVCTACGKRSRDKYGDDAVDKGWDVSCFLHAVLCDESSLQFGEDGRVTKADLAENADGSSMEA